MSETNWSFFRAGGVDQVVLKTGADVAALPKLDKKLWVALACPTKGTEIDEKTLELLDTDKDGRLRPPEILAAIEWAGKAFKSLDVLFEKGTELPLSALDPDDDEGKGVLASAKRILKDRDKKEAKAITIEDVLAMQEVFAQTRFNGDGIVPVEAAGEGPTKKVVEDVIATAGSVTDRSGKPGVDKAIVEAFFKDAAALVAWEDEGKAEAIRPLGDATAAAFDALSAIEAKIEDWFTRARIAAFDGRGALLGASDEELATLAQKALSRDLEAVAHLPLAKIEPGATLPLDGAVNPAWAAKLATFRDAVVKPLLGDKRALSEADFATVKDKLGAHRAWRAKKPTLGVEKLGIDRLRELTSGTARADVEALIAEDAALEAEYAKISLVEKAVRLRRDLLPLLRNFVNFADFYGKKKGAFQAGTLFLDARSCNLCIRVNDAAKHAALAGLAKAYLAYCDCTRTTATGTEKMTIVAAFTAGDVDNLMVGRNGVFYDRKGNDWDATIVSIVENPISVRQAFWSPYKKLLRLIEEQIAKRAADKEKESHGKIDEAAAQAANADQTKVPEPEAAAKEEKGLDVGAVAAIGVAVAGISSFLGLMFGKFIDLGVWMPVGLVALVLSISAPSMLIAWLKLRQRNLGPILDANGWAVNAMCRINVPFGGSLTDVGKLPDGASRSADDPYAEEPTPWALYVVLAVLVTLLGFWAVGKLDGWLPENVQSTKVLHKTAPAAAPAPPASK
jgi:hypothetical protein